MVAWLLIPGIGALIGWLTNWVAVRMLFRPRRPWRIPGTPLFVQGLLPRRRADLARVIAATVERDLLPIDRMLAQWDISELRREIAAAVVERAGERLEAGVPRFLPPPLRQPVIDYLRNLIVAESEGFLADLGERLRDLLKDRLKVGELVESQLAALDLGGLERLVVSVAARELRHIELLGGILGFAIGLIQVLIMQLWM